MSNSCFLIRYVIIYSGLNPKVKGVIFHSRREGIHWRLRGHSIGTVLGHVSVYFAKQYIYFNMIFVITKYLQCRDLPDISSSRKH